MTGKESGKKKMIIFSVAAIICAVIIFAAGFIIIKNMRANYEKYRPDQITETIISDMKYTDLAKVDRSQVSKHYDIPNGTVSDYSIYMSQSSDSASELSCFLLTDISKADAFKNAVTEHLSSKAAGFKSLNPTQYQALKMAVVIQNGKYVFVAVGKNTSEEEKIFMSLTSE
ncbi:MAG TPA: hypothetical protein DIV41_09380 [Ruminococcaceae bacterium]|jgi:hypothetical protein|nr:hypothetical protein [Oscillospiraceae bacterium]